MKAIVDTDYINYSILGIKISNLDVANNIIEFVRSITAGTGVFSTVDINGGQIDNVSIGTSVPAGLIYCAYLQATTGFAVHDGTRIRGQMASDGKIDLIDNTGSPRIHLSPFTNGYINPTSPRTFVFGGTSLTHSGAFFEFAKATSFIARVYMDSGASLTSTLRTYDVGEILDIFYQMYTNGPTSNSWVPWSNIAQLSTQSAANLLAMNSPSQAVIGNDQWVRVSALNQGLNSSNSPVFSGLTIAGAIASGAINCSSVVTTSTITSGGKISTTGSSDIEAGGDLVATENVDVGQELVMRDATTFSLFKRAYNNSHSTSGIWTGGSIRSTAIEMNPVYALQGTNIDSYDMRSYEVSIAASKPTVESVASSIPVPLADILGATFGASNDDHIIIDLDIRLKLYSPSLVTKMKFQYRLVRASAAIRYCVDESFVPSLAAGNLGIYHSASAPAGTNSKGYIAIECGVGSSFLPYLTFLTAAGSTPAFTLLAHGTIKVMQT